MRIKLSSVANPATLDPLNRFFTALEDFLVARLATENLGPVDLFGIVIVSVKDEDEENRKFCKGHNKSGRFVDPFSKERIRFFSIAVPFRPERVIHSEENQLCALLCDAIIRELESTKVKVPEGFDFKRFSADAISAIQAYKPVGG